VTVLVRARFLRGRAGGAIAAVLVSTTMAVTAAPANAATEYRRGPDPTAASQLEVNGSFAYATSTLTDAQTPSTFGAATIYYPTDTSQGTFGAIAISPGYTETQSAISWLGPRLSSHGFVVITFNTNSPYDQPTARATALLGALDYLTGSSSVKGEIDSTRTAVMGHSMGGGGTLEAEQKRPALKAGLPMAPWDSRVTNFSNVTTPTLIIGDQKDTIAPVNSHAKPFYNSLPSTLAKAYAEMAGQTHNYTNTANKPTSRLAVAWMKRFLDNDSRYQQFLCPAPVAPTTEFSAYASTCGTAY
jgi:predicted dienelactone hydrolase